MDDSLGAVSRRARRRLQLGPTARCQCGQREPILLHRTKAGIECADCHARRLRGHNTEKHHPAGSANWRLKLPIPANTHALLSDAQHDWPEDTLRNPRASPARRLAALLRAFVDLLRLVVDPLAAELEELIAWLESLDSAIDKPP